MTDDPWRCRLCGIAYSVPSMARDCERRHIDTDDDGQVLPGGPYTHCRATTATPTGEDRP